jgi:hypothetical protein
MFRWSGVVQFSVWPFDFPDFVGRALFAHYRLTPSIGAEKSCAAAPHNEETMPTPQEHVPKAMPAPPHPEAFVEAYQAPMALYR